MTLKFHKELRLIRDLDPDDELLNDLYPRSDWQQEVHEGNTLLGYYEWIIHQQESNED